MNVIITGSLGYDYIMDFPGRFADRIIPDKIHKISLSFLVDKLSKQFGGTAGNIAYTLKLLGIEPLIVSAAGNDFDPYNRHFTIHKISTKGIAKYKNVTTSSYFVVTDQDDNQIGSFYVGAMKYANDLSIREHLEGGRLQRSVSHDSCQVSESNKAFVVIAPNDPMAMKKYVKESRELQLPYLYDPAFQIATFSPEELREGIEGAVILIGNDYEIELIQNKLDISHEELLVMGPIIVTTLGAKGSIIETRKDAIHIKPAKVKNTSDPTGAGDAYRAGFLAGYLRFSPARGRLARLTVDELQICGQMGSVSAAYTVEKYGTQTHTFTQKEFCQRYEDNYSHPIFL